MNFKHGHARKGAITDTYSTWCSMLARCRQPKFKYYPAYGGRGIRVCEQWLVFSNFLRDMGLRPSRGHSIDRINNDGNYEPGNCRWATRLVQNQNRSHLKKYSYDGKCMTLTEWSKISGIPMKSLWYRLDAGWEFPKAITTPPLRRRRCQV